MVEKVAMRGGLRRLVVVTAAERTNPGKAVTNIRGVGNLAEFPVADAVDAGCDLLGDNLFDVGGEPRLEGRLIKFAAGLARLEQGQQLRRPRQAADMGRQDAVGAELHLVRALLLGPGWFHAPPNRARYGGSQSAGHRGATPVRCLQTRSGLP